MLRYLVYLSSFPGTLAMRMEYTLDGISTSPVHYMAYYYYSIKKHIKSSKEKIRETLNAPDQRCNEPE